MANDRFFAAIKRGDNGQYLDGMVIDTLDEFDYDLPFDKIVSEHCQKVYLWVEIDRKLKDTLLDELMLPIGFVGTGIVGKVRDPVNFRVRGVVLPIVDISTSTGKTEIELRDQTKVLLPVDCKTLTVAAFKSAQTVTASGRIDHLVITSGSYTIGTSKDYATWALFCADVGNLTGDLTGTQQTATTENAVNSLAINMNGYDLNLTSNVTSFPNMFNSGWLTTVSAASDPVFYIAVTSSVAGANLNISKLNFISTNAGAKYLFYLHSNTTNVTHNINDILINSNSKHFSFAYIMYASPTYIFNCIQANGVCASGQLFCTIVTQNNYTTSLIIENCTFYNNSKGSDTAFGIWNYHNVAFTLKNNAIFNTGTYDYCQGGGQIGGLGNAVASACASSDNTGSSGPPDLRSLVAADEFVSLDITSADFLKAESAGTLADNGCAVAIAANIYGIRGNVRPHGALYSVGADEVAAAVSAYFAGTALINKRIHLKTLMGGYLARG